MKGWRLRVHALAALCHDDNSLIAAYPETQLIVRIAVRELFGNCQRYVHKDQLVERSPYVPRSGCVTPIPDWKLQPENQSVLPSNDPARQQPTKA